MEFELDGGAPKGWYTIWYSTYNYRKELADVLTYEQGEIQGIILYDRVDNTRQGEKGVLNFYKWGTSTVQHVNYGVGKDENENTYQLIDASEGDTWQSIRNNNEKQLIKAKPNTVNQTWAPFSTKSNPDIQAYLDFSKLNKDIEIK